MGKGRTGVSSSVTQLGAHRKPDSSQAGPGFWGLHPAPEASDCFGTIAGSSMASFPLSPAPCLHPQPEREGPECCHPWGWHESTGSISCTLMVALAPRAARSSPRPRPQGNTRSQLLPAHGAGAALGPVPATRAPCHNPLALCLRVVCHCASLALKEAVASSFLSPLTAISGVWLPHIEVCHA